MKTLIVGKDIKEIEKLVKSLDFERVSENPELVMTYGGDGTLIHAEREYPGIPKLPMRNSKVCKKCSKHLDETFLNDFLNGKLKLEEYKKLHTKIEGKDLYALNEFVVRNELPIQAIRFRVTVPMSSLRKQGSINNNFYIGDGIVVSTPFGSTGYFKSITGKSFKKGFAVAFNNVTETIGGPIYLDQDKQIEFELVRGNAVLGYDNNPDIYPISVGTKLNFKLSNKVAKIYGYETMRCHSCIVNRG